MRHIQSHTDGDDESVAKEGDVDEGVPVLPRFAFRKEIRKVCSRGQKCVILERGAGKSVTQPNQLH